MPEERKEKKKKTAVKSRYGCDHEKQAASLEQLPEQPTSRQWSKDRQNLKHQQDLQSRAPGAPRVHPDPRQLEKPIQKHRGQSNYSPSKESFGTGEEEEG